MCVVSTRDWPAGNASRICQKLWGGDGQLQGGKAQGHQLGYRSRAPSFFLSPIPTLLHLSLPHLYSCPVCCISLSLSLCVSLSWLHFRFTVGYSYFMLILKLKDLGINIHFTRVIPSIVEVPARLCCIFLLEQIGRKWSLIVTTFQGSLMCLLVLILPSGMAHPPLGNPPPETLLLPETPSSCPVWPTRHPGSQLLHPRPCCPPELVQIIGALPSSRESPKLGAGSSLRNGEEKGVLSLRERVGSLLPACVRSDG